MFSWETISLASALGFFTDSNADVGFRRFFPAITTLTRRPGLLVPLTALLYLGVLTMDIRSRYLTLSLAQLARTCFAINSVKHRSRGCQWRDPPTVLKFPSLFLVKCLCICFPVETYLPSFQTPPLLIVQDHQKGDNCVAHIDSRALPSDCNQFLKHIIC